MVLDSLHYDCEVTSRGRGPKNEEMFPVPCDAMRASAARVSSLAAAEAAGRLHRRRRPFLIRIIVIVVKVQRHHHLIFIRS